MNGLPSSTPDLIHVDELTVAGDSGSLRLQYPPEWFAVVAPRRSSCHVDGRDRLGRRTVTLLPGEVCAIAPHNAVWLSSRTGNRRPVDLTVIRLSTSVLKRAMRTPCELESLHTLHVFDPHVASMAPALRQALENGAGGSYARHAADYLATLLLSSPPEPEEPGRPEWLAAVIRYMYENLSVKVTLDDLAAEAGLSRYHFLRRFADLTGRPPLRFLAELRIDVARRLLTVDDDPVSSVGRRCGFPNPESFSRAFRKIVGVSPSQYRTRVRGGGDTDRVWRAG